MGAVGVHHGDGSALRKRGGMRVGDWLIIEWRKVGEPMWSFSWRAPTSGGTHTWTHLHAWRLYVAFYSGLSGR